LSGLWSEHPGREGAGEIWAEVRVEQVGIHDNFFELGGDSILSIQIVAKANKAGLQLTPKQLFAHQTIAELAAMAGIRTIQAEQGLVTGTLPLTPFSSGSLNRITDPHHWNQAVFLEMHVRDPSCWSR